VEKASDYAAVFEHFRVDAADLPQESCYAFAPVFRTRVAGISAVVKRTRNRPGAAGAIVQWLRRLIADGIPVVTPIEVPDGNPVRIGDRMWVAYPWIEGRRYEGSAADIAAAGDLLGRMHARSLHSEPQLPLFEWPDYDAEESEKDIEDLRRVLKSRAPDIAEPVLARAVAWHREFMEQTLPIIREADVPWVVASTDYKANNLVYIPEGPVFVDPDNADYAPRVIDLALAALLFHNELASAPARLFTLDEWEVFVRAYAAHVTLTATENDLWSTALKYVIVEWGTWTLVNADEWDTWSDPNQHAFLRNLAQATPDSLSIAAFRPGIEH
jgi:Ser/Thr protein kinase RdoA (MazF antagonist)